MAQSFYQSLQSLPATALTTPASLKRAYADAKQAYAAFVPLVEQAQAQAQTAGQTANAARFRNLVELYNEQYQKLAAAGKKQAAAALARADAGYGNSYAGAVSEQAFNRHMAEQGAQMPALLAAAAAAEARDKAAQVSAAERVIAAQKQQQGAAQALVKSEMQQLSAQNAARKQAFETLYTQLQKAYNTEKKAAKAASGSSRKRSGSGTKSTKGSSGSRTKSTTASAKSEKWKYYRHIKAQYPSVGSALLSPTRYEERFGKGDLEAYIDYAKRVVYQLIQVDQYPQRDFQNGGLVK